MATSCTDDAKAMRDGASADAIGIDRPRRGETVRVAGLDTIRLICALVVVHCHCSKSLQLDADQFTWLPLKIAVALLSNATPASAAVTTFFVISGFCIHYAGAPHAKIPFFRFVARRWTRIWLPLLAALGLARLLDMPFELYAQSVLWSVYAEIIYYTIYPVIHLLARRVGWMTLIVASYVAALGVAATQPGALEYPSFGLAGNWLLGLPCWLLGCLLAEQIRGTTVQSETPAVSSPWLAPELTIWFWRLAVWAAATASSVVRFHLHIGLPWTLNFFALLVFFWLRREILLHNRVRPWRWTESLGAMTYSIYIVHLPIYRALASHNLLRYGPLTNTAITWTLVFVGSVVFYYAVEAPSHRLAQKIRLK